MVAIKTSHPSEGQMTMTDYSKKQLATILSALDDQPRNPADKSSALAAIKRHADELGCTVEHILEAAAGLLDGRMSAEDFRFAVGGDEGATDAPDDDAATDVTDAAEDAPVATTAAQEADPAAIVHVVENVHLVDGEPCPLCGRTYRAPKPRRERQPREPRAPRQPGQPREGTKEAMVIEMLRRPEGATIAQIVEATDWRQHTIRGFFAAALKKRHGMQVTSEKAEKDQPRVYRVVL